ncbi:hypothetical protein BDN67DRAFT_59198 [Paxillus ammoniavirescens]|nr:hypothetical protein BDN67DRAFT_59198 [Paxillus ammoniavirescens]
MPNRELTGTRFPSHLRPASYSLSYCGNMHCYIARGPILQRVAARRQSASQLPGRHQCASSICCVGLHSRIMLAPPKVTPTALLLCNNAQIHHVWVSVENLIHPVTITTSLVLCLIVAALLFDSASQCGPSCT